MLKMRARGFALRDKFSDALKGLITVEEARDYNVIASPKGKSENIPHVEIIEGNFEEISDSESDKVPDKITMVRELINRFKIKEVKCS